MEVAPVTIFFAGQRNHLKIAQRFQTVALQIGFGGHRRIAQLRARFDIEQEQQTIHIPQAFAAQLIRVNSSFPGVIGQLVVDEITHRFIAQQLNALTQGIFQIFRHAKRMFVRIVIQRIEVRRTAAWQQRIFV